MWAEPVLAVVARAMRRINLDGVLIGNAAAALNGAPVTTVDLDFLIRGTPANARKLKALAKEMGAVIFRPYYPVSGLYRLMRNRDNLQVDFMTAIHGVGSFEGPAFAAGGSRGRRRADSRGHTGGCDRFEARGGPAGGSGGDWYPGVGTP
jgi:hypothetical protein